MDVHFIYILGLLDVAICLQLELSRTQRECVIALVENMVKKNRSRLSIAVLLTTRSAITTQLNFFVLFLFYDCNLKKLGACNTPLER